MEEENKLLNKARKSVRMTHTALDDEILTLINACKIDLKISGLKNINEDNDLIVFAIILYCKANFGSDNKEAEQLKKSYLLTKQQLVFGELGGVI